MNEYYWLIQYLLGLLVGYYIISPRLRRFINRIIVKIFRFFFPFKDTKPRNQYIKLDKNRVIKLKRQEPKIQEPIIKLNKREVEIGQGGILVGEEEIDKWLDDNPDLREVNR